MTSKVLIVDDEPNIVISLEFLMNQAGYVVEIARNGEDALDLIASFLPDLVLLDVMLPRVDGFDVCQRVRENAEWDAIKIVMLTAKGREVEVARRYLWAHEPEGGVIVEVEVHDPETRTGHEARALLTEPRSE